MAGDQEVVITGQGLLSAYGLGSEVFAEGVVSRREPEPGERCGPLDALMRVPGFDARKQLGRAGTHGFDRTTGMVVYATMLALAQRSLGPDSDRSRVGVVVGSAHGSLRSIVEFTQDVFVQRRPYMVNPAHVPNTVMNCAAGQAAIWHRLEGVNATVSSGSTSSFSALDYARIMLVRGYADHVIAGGVEESSEQTAWRFNAERGQHEVGLKLGEACGMFVLETQARARSTGAKVFARLRSVRVSPRPVMTDEGDAARLAHIEACMRQALDDAQVEPRQLWATCRGGPGLARVSHLEAWALRRICGGDRLAHQLCLTPLLGDTLSASGAVQLAAVLALYQRSPQRDRGPALCSAALDDGSVACMIVDAEDS